MSRAEQYFTDVLAGQEATADTYYEKAWADIAKNTYSIVFSNKDSNSMKASLTKHAFLIPDDANIQQQLNNKHLMAKLLKFIAQKQVLKIDIIGGGILTASTSANTSYEDSILEQLLQKLNDRELLYNSTNKNGVIVWLNNLTCFGVGTPEINEILAKYDGTFIVSHLAENEENQSSPSIYNFRGFENVKTQTNRHNVSSIIQDKINEIIKAKQSLKDYEQDKNNVEHHKLPLQNDTNKQNDIGVLSTQAYKQDTEDYNLIDSYIRGGFQVVDFGKKDEVNNKKNKLLQAIQRQFLEYSRGKYSHIIRIKGKTVRENLVCRHARACINNKPEAEKLKQLETIAKDIYNEGINAGCYGCC